MQHEPTSWQTKHLSHPPAPGAAVAATRDSRQRWAWGSLAAVALLLLLYGLLQVLQTAVQQGETLRATTRQQSEAFWHCNALGTPADRHACRHQSLQPEEPAPRTPAQLAGQVL